MRATWHRALVGLGIAVGVAVAAFATVTATADTILPTATPSPVSAPAPTAVPGGTVTPVPVVPVQPTSTPTTTGALSAIPTATATDATAIAATATASAVPAATAIPTATTVTRPARFVARLASRGIVARADTATPSVDLTLAPVTSTVLGPGQTIALDLIMRAGSTGIVGFDGYLDFDPARLQVTSVDITGSPLEAVLQNNWDNRTGHVNLSAGAFANQSSGAYPSGYFRVARITIRPTDPFTTTSSLATTTLSFASDYLSGRETAVLAPGGSVLRQKTPATITLDPAAVAPPEIATSTFTSIYRGIPGDVTFTVLGANNRPLAGASYTATFLPGGASTVTPSTGTTDANGRATISIAPDPQGTATSGIVDLAVTGTGVPGGSVTLSRLITIATPVPVAVTIASPTFLSPTFRVLRGTVPLLATATFGTVPAGTTFSVELAFTTDASNPDATVWATISIATIADPATGRAEASWDTTVAALAPPGTTRQGVVLRATARAVNAGITVGLKTTEVTGLVIDNQAPTLDAVALNGTPVADDATRHLHIATRTFTFTGITEAGSTVRAYRLPTLGATRTDPIATAIATTPNDESALRAVTPNSGVAPRTITTPATGTFTLVLPDFTEADETATGFYLDLDATDPVGNTGPVTLATASGTATITPNPWTVWVSVDTVAPRVASIATPTFDPGIGQAPLPITITFTEAVVLTPADYGGKVRFEQLFDAIPRMVPATMSVTCADDPAPTVGSSASTRAIMPASGPVNAPLALPTVATRNVSPCSAGTREVAIIPTEPLYPGSTYIVTIGDATVPARAVRDLAGNTLATSLPDGPPTNTVTFLAPGVVAYPQVGITGIETDAVIHSTAATPLPLRAATANIDTPLTWRLCANASCSDADGGTITPIGIASPTFSLATTTFDVVNWDTMATNGSGVRTFPDRADAYIVVEGRNLRLSGQAGYTRDVRHITLRSTPPEINGEQIRAVPCASGEPGDATLVANAIFNMAQDCDQDVTGFQTTVTGTIQNAVGGTITVTAQVGSGTPVNLVTAKPYGRTGTVAWTTLGDDPRGWVTIPNGREVTIGVTATDRAVPVPNVASATATARVDTVAPVVVLNYPANATRLSAPNGTLDVPVTGGTEPLSTVELNLRRIDVPSTIFEEYRPATSTFAFRFPATGGTNIGPGTYQVTARATDDAGNPGRVATSTFQVTPPPPVAILGVPGANGKVGKGDDADPDTDGVQIVLQGNLPVDTTAAQVPEGLVARLIRNGKDALGDGNRPVIAPVIYAVPTYTFAFPALSFRADATAEYTVVTSDDAGNRSAPSNAVDLTVDLTAPAFTVATPRDGATVGSLRPELAAVIAPSANGTYDTSRVQFEVRKAASPTFRLIRDMTIDPATLASGSDGAGVVRVTPDDWNNAGVLDGVEAPATENYVLRVTATDDVGNIRAASSTFVLKPGVPSVTITQGGAAVLGTVDVSGDAPPEIGVTAGVTGEGVTLRSVTATIRNRAGTVTTTVPLTGEGTSRTFDFSTIPLPNGTIHDLAVTATDSNDRLATAGATLRIVRPRDLAVTVQRGGSVATGTMVILRRDGGDLPPVSVDQVTSSSGIATFTGVRGGPVLIAVKDVPGYPVTTVAANVTEPHAAATWTFTIDLDALNPNTVTTTLRGLPASVSGSASLGSLVKVDVIAPSGAQFSDTAIGSATSGLVHTFANSIARIDRQVTPASPVATGTVVTTTTHLPRGAVAWRVIPTLSGSAADDAKGKGASEAAAVFGSGTTGENVPVSFRYAATNLRVKSLSGTVSRTDGSSVPGATIVIAQPGGLSVTTTTTLVGTFGPVLLEAGDYIVTAVASAGSDWLPGRAGRISFAPGDPPVVEAGTVDLRVLAAGGTVQARVTRAVAGSPATLATGKVILNGQGQVITATAGAAVLPGQDASTGPNVTIAAPSGIYVLTVVPDDASLTPPDPLTIRVIDGKTRTITADELPPMEKTLGRLTGLVRLTTGEPLAGLTVQARRDGEASVIPATTDDAGIYSVAAPAGSYIVSAVIPRGAALLPGNAMAAVVVARTTTTVGDLAIAPAAAVIERNLVKTGGSLTEDEAAGLSGTAFVKNLATGAGTSITFSGTRVRISVPVGTYRLGIAVIAGGFLAPEAETGIVASASAPNVATRTVTPSNIPVTGNLVTGQTDTAAGTSVALRTVVRATGTSGPASGVVNLTESTPAGAFTFALAPGTWRLASSPDASQGYLTNPDRPYTMVTVDANGTSVPASPGIDLRAASRTVTGTASVSINNTDVPLAGVKVRLEVTGSTGGALSLSEVTDRDGLFTFAAPTGTATISASGASARYGTSAGGVTADDPAYVIDPAPAGVPDGIAPVSIRFTNASIKVAGTVATVDGRPVGGVTVSASSNGLVRTTTTSGGKDPGRYEFRLSPGVWGLMAATEVTRADGSRVPASSVDTPVTVVSTDQTGQGLTLIESAVELPPSATAGADTETGGQVRAGKDSAQLVLAPNAVSEAVNVSIDPLGNVPSVPGFFPFGDAFRISATTASSNQAVGTLAVDSTITITYSRTDLAKFSATGNQVPATATDLRAALFDASASSYTAFDGAVATVIDDATGQFVISTTNLGTFVLTTRSALTRIVPIVTGVTAATPSSGTLNTGASVAITVNFDLPVTVVTSGGTPRIAMGTGTNGAARTPATYATYTSGSGTTSLTFTYTVVSGDAASDLDYASASALEANGGTIRNADGFNATLTLATPGQAGSISIGSAIVIDTTTVPATPVPTTGGGGDSGTTTTAPVTTAKPVISVVVLPGAAPGAAPGVPALPIAPVSSGPAGTVTGPPGLSTDGLSGAIAAIPGGLSPAAAATIGEALGAVDVRTARAFIDTMVGLPAAQAAHVLGVIASGTAEEARAAIAATSTLPPGATIARPGGSLRAPGGAETFTYSLDEDAAPAQAHLVGDVEVAGAHHATTARGPVVFLVRGGQAALVTRPRAGAWPDLRFPLLAGFLAGTGPSVALPADATSLTFEPAPDGLNIVERGSLGGGIVVPMARPFAIRVEATNPSARVGFALPSPKVGGGQVLAYLHSLRAPDGKFQGYLRAPAAFDGATGSQTWTLDTRASTDLLVLVAAIQPGYVQNFDAGARFYSGPDNLAIDFGEAGPAFTTFTVVGPQVGARIFVYSPVSKGYGWIDATGVGPSGPPRPDAAPSPDTTTADPVTPAPLEPPPGPPTDRRPDFVQNLSATARLFSSPYDDAADFGPIGAAFVTFVVVGGPENGHLHVYNPTTMNYAWIEARDLAPADPPAP